MWFLCESQRSYLKWSCESQRSYLMCFLQISEELSNVVPANRRGAI